MCQLYPASEKLEWLDSQFGYDSSVFTSRISGMDSRVMHCLVFLVILHVHQSTSLQCYTCLSDNGANCKPQVCKFGLFGCFKSVTYNGGIDPLTLDLKRLCIDEILQAISASTSCVEITSYFLNRTRTYNPLINAFITIDDHGALEAAQRLDRFYQKNHKFIGKLHCVPTLIKDNIVVKGLPITLGLAVFANSTAREDAPAVQKLRKAGAIILGKGNMSPMAIGAPEEPSVAGVVKNPHSLENFACSSSSGNAAALAARLVVIGLTSDTSGSTSGPAMTTHVVGLRPPTQYFNMSGLAPLAGPAIDTMGLMALRVKDICILLDVVSDDDQRKNHCSDDSNNIKIGIIGNLTYGSFTDNGFLEQTHVIDEEVKPAFRRFHENLTRLNNVSVDLLWDDVFHAVYSNATLHHWIVSMCDRLSRFLEEFWEQHEMVVQQSGSRVRNLENLLSALRSVNTSFRYYWYEVLLSCEDSDDGLLESIENITAQIDAIQKLLEDALFEKYDVLVMTNNPHGLVALASTSFGAGSLPGYGSLLVTTHSTRQPDMASVFACPSLSVPIGFTEISVAKWESLPVSAYFMTVPGKFSKMLKLASRYEDVYWDPKIPDEFID